MKTNPERKKAVKECDKYFSLYIRERDEHKCYCGHRKVRDEAMQCCHLFSRSNYSTRWREEFSACGHAGCNYLHESHPERMTLWFIKKFGHDAYERGVMLHNSVFKISNAELGILANEFKMKYEALKGGS